MAGSSSSSMGQTNDECMGSQWGGQESQTASSLGRPRPRRVHGAEQSSAGHYTSGPNMSPQQFTQGPYSSGPRMPPFQSGMGLYSSGPSMFPYYPSQYAQYINTMPSGSGFMPPGSGFMASGSGCMHMLHGEDGTHGITPSTNSAFSLTSSHSDKGTNMTSGSSKKSGRRSDGDVAVTSPSKKAKNKAHKAHTNKVWLTEHDNVLIPFLADQARQGNKADKTFKSTAFTSAAAHINDLFGTEYSGQHVRNHMKGLGRRLSDVLTCFEISGAGWCEELKTIQLDREVYEPWAAANPRLKDYVNQPLLWLDDLRLIIGDDAAKGDFRRVVYEPFGGLNDDVEGNPPSTPPFASAASMEQETPTNIPDGSATDGMPTGPNVGSPPSVGRRRRGRRSLNDDPDLMMQMVGKVGEVADALKLSNAHWTEVMGTRLYTHVEHSTDVLNQLFDELCDNERERRRFMAMPEGIRKVYLQKMVDSMNARRHQDATDGQEGSD